MRIKVKFTKNINPVNINNQHQVNGYIHKCLGANNEYHNSKNDYCISNLCGGRLNNDKKTLSFNNGSFLIVTSQNMEFLNQLMIGISNQDNIELFDGMKYDRVEFIGENFHNGWNYFVTLSPFILKEYSDKKHYDFITLNDTKINEKLTNHLKNKLSKIDSNININNIKVEISENINNRFDTKMVKNVKNIANSAHINIYCDKKTAELIYNIGFGQSTGSGFGTIYKTENHHLYRN